MVQIKWAVATCENCGYYFALDNSYIPRDASCPNCASEDVMLTGEYLDDSLYTKNGTQIQ